MCKYCERRTDVKLGWDQPELPWHDNYDITKNISGNMIHLAERDYKKLLNDYRSLTIVGLGSALESFDMSPNNFPADPFDDGDCLIVLLVYRWFIYQYAK